MATSEITNPEPSPQPPTKTFGEEKSVCLVWIQLTENFQSHTRTISGFINNDAINMKPTSQQFKKKA